MVDHPHVKRVNPSIEVVCIEPNGAMLPIPTWRDIPMQIIEDQLVLTSTDNNGCDLNEDLSETEIAMVGEYLGDPS